MAFDFPASPSVGTVYAPIGGPVWQWNGVAWMQGGSAPVASFAIISDTAPGSPGVGQMWFEATTGSLFIWYNDGDSSQWVQVNATSG